MKQDKSKVGDLVHLGGKRIYRIVNVNSATVTVVPYYWWAPLAWAFGIGIVLGYVLSVVWSYAHG